MHHFCQKIALPNEDFYLKHLKMLHRAQNSYQTQIVSRDDKEHQERPRALLAAALSRVLDLLHPRQDGRPHRSPPASRRLP